jgi:hypothetical protein
VPLSFGGRLVSSLRGFGQTHSHTITGINFNSTAGFIAIRGQQGSKLVLEVSVGECLYFHS